MSDYEDIIDMDNNYANESCINTYSSDNNQSQSVKLIKLGSLSLDDDKPMFKPKIIAEKSETISVDDNSEIESKSKEKKIESINDKGQKVKVIEIIDNNGWNKRNEKLLSYWKEESHIIIWLNTQALNELKFINKALSIPAILISAISSATLFSNFNTENDSERVNVIILIIGILLIISTFIQSYKEFLNLEKNIRQHISTIKANQILILDIQEQLNQEIHDRVNGKEFLSKIKLKKADMVRNNVEIPAKIYKKMERAIENGDIINYDETFILYSYLQNKLTNHSIMNPSSNYSHHDNLRRFVSKNDTRINIPPFPQQTVSEFDGEKAIIEPYENLDKLRDQVAELKEKEKNKTEENESIGSMDSLYSQDSATNLQADKNKDGKGKRKGFEAKTNDYVRQIKNELARL